MIKLIGARDVISRKFYYMYSFDRQLHKSTMVYPSLSGNSTCFFMFYNVVWCVFCHSKNVGL